MRNATLTLILAAGLVLAGCGKPQAPASSSGGDKQTTLTFWHIINYTDILDNVARDDAKASPGLTIRTQTFQNDAYKNKLNIEMASGTPPDVFFTWGGGRLAALAKAGRILDLSPAMAEGGWRESFMGPALKFCSVGKQVYAAPLDIACVPVWYNGEVFDRHGLKPPKTFAELLDVCGKLKAKGITPFALGNRDRWPGAFYFIYLATRIGGAQLFYDAAARKPGAKLNDAAFVRAGALLQKLVKTGAFPKGCNGLADGAARTRFLNGKAAMYLMGTWLVARVKKEKPDFMTKLRLFPFPVVKGGRGDASTVVGGVNCAFAVSSKCKDPKAAVGLVRALTSQATARAWAGIGRIPAVKLDDADLVSLPRPTAEAFKLLRAAKTIQFYYDQYLPPRLVKVHKDTTQGLFAGTLTPKQAADMMEAAAGK